MSYGCELCILNWIWGPDTIHWEWNRQKNNIWLCHWVNQCSCFIPSIEESRLPTLLEKVCHHLLFYDILVCYTLGSCGAFQDNFPSYLGPETISKIMLSTDPSKIQAVAGMATTFKYQATSGRWGVGSGWILKTLWLWQNWKTIDWYIKER